MRYGSGLGMGAREDYLEEQADELLKDACKLGIGSGVYTETQLRRHSRREVVNCDIVLECLVVADMELTEMVVSDLRDLGRLAGLTDLQQDAWNLRVLGLSIREIARACGISNHAAYSRLELSRFKVIKCMVHYPYFGLWDVYYQLIRRGHK